MSAAPKALIFDFDGTLCDSFAVAMQVFNEVAREMGLRGVTPEEMPGLRRLRTRQILQALGIPMLRVPATVARVRERMTARMDGLGPIAGTPEALARLEELGFRMGILTSNSEENVRRFLERHRFPRFELIHSGSSLFGKAGFIKRSVRQLGLRPEQVVCVGDETRDIEAARAVGTPCLAVSWGFASREALEELEPDWLADRPEEMVRALEAARG